MADLIGKTILQLTMVDGVIDPDKSYVEIHQVGMPYSQRIAVSALAKNGLSAKQVVQLSHPEVVTDEDFINFISGADGQSAYDLARGNGYVGTLTQWLASLKGAAGKDGLPGANGKSVYQLAQESGYSGTLNDWLASLVGKQGASGADGKSAYQIAKDAGYPGTITQWLASLQGIPGSPGLPGQDGKSAYQLAKESGFPGTLADYLTSLQGPPGRDGADGAQGPDGKSSYELAKEDGFVGTLEDYLESLHGADGYNGADGQPGAPGVDGKSAYEIAQGEGFSGTVLEWLVSLRGPAGQDGLNGTDGRDGVDGVDGKDGASVIIKGLIDAPENLPDGEPLSTAYIIDENIWIMGEGGWFDAGPFRGEQGPPGLSAYQLAQSTGFSGSLAQYLDSLKGPQGPQGIPGLAGPAGKSAYQEAVDEGFEGTFEQWLLTLRGENGKSAYELAVDEGFQGTLTQWLASLVGPAGPAGDGSGGTGGNALGATEVLVPDSSVSTSNTFDGALGNLFNVTLTADFVVPAVLHPQPGVKYRFLLKQDHTGQHKITLDRKYKFVGNITPSPSLDGQSIDLLEADYSSDGFFFAKYYKGFNITPIARIGATPYDSMALAVTASKNNDTIYVTRNGSMGECIASLRTDQTLTIAGDPSLTDVPRLHVDGTITLAGQKGILNPEAGYTVVRDLALDGASTPDLSGSGIRGNPGQRYMRLERVKITQCENGILYGTPSTANTLTEGYNFEAIDTVFDANGQGYDGQSHNIYLNHKMRGRFLRCQFTNAKHGHDFKSRAAFLLMDRVVCKGALEAREMDLPNGCILHAVNCSFIKLPNQSAQWELVGIGREGVDNVEEYIFRNCLFQNDAPNFGPCWVAYENTKTTPVAMKFIDCVFIGSSRNHIASPIPYEVYYTGGPVGPEGWDQSNKGVFPKWGKYDGAAGTVYYADNLQPQPIYAPDPTLTAFPPTGSTATRSTRPEIVVVDVSPPQVTLQASSVNFMANGTLTLTVNATDDTGVTMVELYQDGELIDMDSTVPYSFSRQISSANNGTLSFTAKAYDTAGNVGTSTAVEVAVNITQLPGPTEYPFSMDATTTTVYNNAIDSATLGTKRMAGANAIASEFGTDYSLNIYQEGTLVIPFVFASSMIVADDGTDVTVRTPTPNPTDPLVFADITQGTWHFELILNSNPAIQISGSVGPVGSGKMIEIADNPEPGSGQALTCVLVVPRSVDGLS